MISLTKLAATEINKIATGQELTEPCLRVGVKGGGCSGFSYVLDLVTSDTKKEIDEVFESEGIKIFCDQKSYLYLNGLTIDFKDEIMGRGFVFSGAGHNKCGCGSSFNID